MYHYLLHLGFIIVFQRSILYDIGHGHQDGMGGISLSMFYVHEA